LTKKEEIGILVNVNVNISNTRRWTIWKKLSSKEQQLKDKSLTIIGQIDMYILYKEGVAV